VEEEDLEEVAEVKEVDLEVEEEVLWTGVSLTWSLPHVASPQM
jgi:hypothetical protein